MSLCPLGRDFLILVNSCQNTCFGISGLNRGARFPDRTNSSKVHKQCLSTVGIPSKKEHSWGILTLIPHTHCRAERPQQQDVVTQMVKQKWDTESHTRGPLAFSRGTNTGASKTGYPRIEEWSLTPSDLRPSKLETTPPIEKQSRTVRCYRLWIRSPTKAKTDQ